MKKYEMPNQNDIKHVANIQKESQKGLKKTVIST